LPACLPPPNSFLPLLQPPLLADSDAEVPTPHLKPRCTLVECCSDDEVLSLDLLKLPCLHLLPLPSPSSCPTDGVTKAKRRIKSIQYLQSVFDGGLVGGPTLPCDYFILALPPGKSKNTVSNSARQPQHGQHPAHGLLQCCQHDIVIHHVHLMSTTSQNVLKPWL
jgi:hypothetical protein